MTVAEWVGMHGRLFWIADISRIGPICPEARRATAGIGKRTGISGCAIFGGSFQQRLITTLTVTAAKLLRTQELAPITYVPTEADARLWVSDLRNRLDLELHRASA
ncbi:hypothetical protein [Chondromyces crocatus]|nr:hypothetical protein [Chondromyces crocatus]